MEGGTEPEARAGALDLATETPRLGSKVIEARDVLILLPKRGDDGAQRSHHGPRSADRLGVVGANGSGKSTLLELLAGLRHPSAGTVEHGSTARIGYFSQQGPAVDPSARVRDLVAGPGRAAGDPADVRLMERFWFTGELPWATAGTLSGGERRRLQLLMVLASRPNVLLLDEPTNDLDLDTLWALEDFLDDWPGAMVAVSHDRTFLDRVTERVLVCRVGRVEEVPGGLSAWIADSVAGEGRGYPAPTARPGAPAASRGTRGRNTGQEPPSIARAGVRSATTIGFELRQLDKELTRLSRERDRLAEEFESATDHRDLAAVGARLAEAQARLDETEERWLALAEEAEGARQGT